MNRSGLLIGVAEDSGKMVGFGMDRFGGLSPGIVSPIILAIGEKGWDMCGLGYDGVTGVAFEKQQERKLLMLRIGD